MYKTRMVRVPYLTIPEHHHAVLERREQATGVKVVDLIRIAIDHYISDFSHPREDQESAIGETQQIAPSVS